MASPIGVPCWRVPLARFASLCTPNSDCNGPRLPPDDDRFYSGEWHATAGFRLGADLARITPSMPEQD